MNHFDYTLLSFTQPVEDDEGHSQSHSSDYDWLGPELTQNIRGRYIPIFPLAIVMLTSPGIAQNL